MILQEHVDRAVLEACPFQKQSCFLASVGACLVVNTWATTHRAHNNAVPAFILPQKSEFYSNAGRKGGASKALRMLIDEA